MLHSFPFSGPTTSDRVSLISIRYTVPYMIHTDHLQFTVTSHEQMPRQEFADNLGKAADMIMDMMESAAETKL